MNSTIAVALITAIATLSGGCIASVTSIIVQRRQVQLQTTVSIQEHREQREAQRRQIRRDAYVKLLTQFEEAHRMIGDCWRSTPPATLDEAELLRHKVSEQHYGFIAVLVTVYLEGPIDVRNAAAELAVVLRDEIDLIYYCIREGVGKEGRLTDFAGNDKKPQIGEMWKAESKFISVAGKALDDITALWETDLQGRLQRHPTPAD